MDVIWTPARYHKPIINWELVEKDETTRRDCVAHKVDTSSRPRLGLMFACSQGAFENTYDMNTTVYLATSPGDFVIWQLQRRPGKSGLYIQQGHRNYHINRTESFDRCRDLKLSLELLNHTMVMDKLAALEIQVTGQSRRSQCNRYPMESRAKEVWQPWTDLGKEKAWNVPGGIKLVHPARHP